MSDRVPAASSRLIMVACLRLTGLTVFLTLACLVAADLLPLSLGEEVLISNIFAISPAILALLLLYTAMKLMPVQDALKRAWAGEVLGDLEIRKSTQIAMWFPIAFLLGGILVALGVGGICLVTKLLLGEELVGGLSSRFCELITIVLVFGMMAYLVLRSLLRPALVTLNACEVPLKGRFGVRLRLTLWLVLLMVIVASVVMLGAQQTTGALLHEMSRQTDPGAEWHEGWITLSAVQMTILGALIVLGAFTGWLLGQDIRTPAMEIKKHLDRMTHSGGGKSIERLAVYSTSEVGRIAMVFNRLADRLEREHAQLGDYAKQVQRTETLRSRFLANVSHELRTPLSSIIGFSDILLEGVDGEISQQQREGLRIINKEGERLLGLINDILLTARIEAGRYTLIKSKYRFSEWLQDVIEALGSERSQRVKVSLGFSDTEGWVQGDRHQLTRALVGILDSAVDTLTEEPIAMSVFMEGEDTLRIRVECSSSPVSEPDEVEKIFEGFRQVHRRAGAGFGISFGLPLAKKIARLHGGDVVLTMENGTYWLEMILPRAWLVEGEYRDQA